MSELLENKVNACIERELEKMLPGFTQASEKSAMKMKVVRIIRKNDTRIKCFDGKKEFIRYAQKTRTMDINQLQMDDC